MPVKPAIALAVSLAVLGTSLAVANHLGALPPVSRGGELAYVRNYDADALGTAGAGEEVTATYVAFTLDDNNRKQDRLEGFASRGRMADAVVIHKADLPDGTFANLSFAPVDHIERGVLVATGPSACLSLLNGVNAGTSLVAKRPVEVRYLVTGKFDVSQADDGRVRIERDGHTYALAVIGNGTASVDGGNIRFDLGAGAEVRGGIAREYPATAKVADSTFDHLKEQCLAVPPGPEPEPEPEPTVVDVSVDKSVSQDAKAETARFDLVVESVGTANATGVVLKDPLPDVKSAWFLGGADAEDCVLDGTNLTCDFGELASGDGRSVTVTAYTKEVCGEIPNTATVSADGDAVPANNQDTASIVLEPCDVPEPEGADVGVTKSVVQDTETATFTLTLVNRGPAVAVGDGVYMNDTLPDTGSAWFIGGPDAEACALDGRKLVCHWEEVPAGESRSVTARGYIIGLCGEDLKNAATVWAENDSTPGNNTASASIDLPDCPPEGADVGIAKSVVQDAETATFTLVVDNDGPADAVNVTMSDPLPPLGSPYFLGGADAEDCRLEGDLLTCAFGDVPAGETRTVTARGYIIGLCGERENTATVAADNDASADDNAASATIVSPPCADASVNKTATQDAQAVVFTLRVDAIGPGDSENVTLQDTLPDIGREWYLGGADSEDCALVGRELTCDFGDLAAGAQRSVTAKAYTDRMACGPDVVNTAYVHSDNDSNAANDQSSAAIRAPACPAPSPSPAPEPSATPTP